MERKVEFIEDDARLGGMPWLLCRQGDTFTLYIAKWTRTWPEERVERMLEVAWASRDAMMSEPLSCPIAS